MPLEAPINPDNHRYLAAKVARAGHLLNHPLAHMPEDDEEDRVASRLSADT